jgi:hypothetical protein
MAKAQRQAKISYCYDRLWEQKLSQVYHLIVPDTNSKFSDQLSEPIDATAYEDSSHLYQSLLRSSEGE